MPPPMFGFTNNPIAPNALPRLEEKDFNGLDRSYLMLQLAMGAVRGLVALGLAVALIVVLGDDLPGWARLATLAVGVAILVLPFILEPIAFRYRGWLVREHDVSVRSGVIRRSVTTAPFSRVQHASVHQGALERMAGLWSLKIFTAGNHFADLTVDGLKQGEAASLKEFVLSRTEQDG